MRPFREIQALIHLACPNGCAVQLRESLLAIVEHLEELDRHIHEPDGDDDWLPIETAPKDGTYILLWAATWRHPFVGQASSMPYVAWVDIPTPVATVSKVFVSHWRALPDPLITVGRFGNRCPDARTESMPDIPCECGAGFNEPVHEPKYGGHSYTMGEHKFQPLYQSPLTDGAPQNYCRWCNEPKNGPIHTITKPVDKSSG